MRKKPTSTQLAFVLTNEQTLTNIDQLKLVDYDKFCKANQVGKLITALAKSDEWRELQ